MSDIINNNDLELLFRKYERAPDSYVFAPLADAYRKAGMLEEAAEICKKGILKHARYPVGYVVQGKCHFDQGEMDAAEESFRTVLGLDDNNLVALKYLGMIEAGRGMMDAARERFGRILELDPDNNEIKKMLEDLHMVEEPITQSGSKVIEDEDFEGETISLGGGDEETSDELATTTLADIYAAQGYSSKAARIYLEILEKQPGNDEIRSKLRKLDTETDFTSEQTDEKIDTGEKPVAETVNAVTPDAHDPGETDNDGDEMKEKSVPVSAGSDTGEPLKRKRPASRSAAPVSGPHDPNRNTIDDQKSYEQFRRWLKNSQS